MKSPKESCKIVRKALNSPVNLSAKSLIIRVKLWINCLIFADAAAARNLSDLQGFSDNLKEQFGAFQIIWNDYLDCRIQFIAMLAEAGSE